MNDASLGPNPLPTGTVSRRKPSITLLHAIDGRCRWRVPRLAHDPQLRQRLESGLGADARVLGFEVNPRCDSLTVRHHGSAQDVAVVLRRAMRPPAANPPQNAPATSSAVAQAPLAPTH